MCKVSLALNNQFTEVFQTIVSVLHSLRHLCCVAITTYIAIGCDFVSAHASCSHTYKNFSSNLHVTCLLHVNKGII